MDVPTRGAVWLVLIYTTLGATHGLTLTPCVSGVFEVEENRGDNTITCSGLSAADVMNWVMEYPTDPGVDYSLVNCQPSGTCAPLLDTSGFSAVRGPPYTSSVLSIDGSASTAYFDNTVLKCKQEAQTTAACRPDHILSVEGASCNHDYHTDVTPWTVRASCSVTKAYSRLGRYTCQLVQTAPSPSSTFPTVAMTTTDLSGGKYKSGTCDVTGTLPSQTGTYSYKVVLSPGTLDVTLTTTIRIRRPSTPPTHDCPLYVPEGGDLNCRCSGDVGEPAGTVQWTSTTQALTPSSQLSISSVQKGQSGAQFTCQLSWNGEKVAETTYTLGVAYGPDLTTVTPSSSSPFDTDGSRDLTLSCSVDDVSPTPALFAWSRDGGSDVIHTGASYTFRPQREDDRSVFTCVARNSFTGRTSSGSVTVELNYPPTTDPVITASSDDLYQGDPVTLTCTVEGGKPANATTLTFTCGDKGDEEDEAVGSTGVSSHVRYVSLTSEDQDAVCTCRTKWNNTEWYSRTNTTIISFYAPPSPPIIPRPSTGYPFIAGEAGTLTCHSDPTGRPDAAYSWPGYDGSLQGTDGGRGTLTLDPLTRGDDGKTVTCKASNRYTDNRQPVADGTFQLEVYYAPVITISGTGSNQCVLTSDLSTCAVTQGQRVEVNCTSESKPAPASTVWKRGDVTISSNSVLSIDVTDPSQHTDLFTCDVTTGSLTGHSGRAPLSASYPLQIYVKYQTELVQLSADSQSHNLTVNEGQPVTLTCQADGRPSPSMHLFRDQQEVASSVGDDDVTQEGARVEHPVDRADCRDAGVYTCRAGNSVNSGTVTSNATTLFVNCSPRSLTSEPPQLKANYRGSPLEVPISLLASPLPQQFNFSRQQDGDGGSEGGRTGVPPGRLAMTCAATGSLSVVRCSITVDNVTRADAGLYTVTVANSQGHVQLPLQVLFYESASSEDESRAGSNLGGAVGGGVAAVVVVIIIVVVVVIVVRRRGVSPFQKSKGKQLEPAGGGEGTSQGRSLSLHQLPDDPNYELVDGVASGGGGGSSGGGVYVGLNPADVGIPSSYETWNKPPKRAAQSGEGQVYEGLQEGDVGQKAIYSQLQGPAYANSQVDGASTYFNTTSADVSNYVNNPSADASNYINTHSAGASNYANTPSAGASNYVNNSAGEGFAAYANHPDHHPSPYANNPDP